MIKKTIALIVLYVVAFLFISTAIGHYVTDWYRHRAFIFFVGSLLAGILVFRQYLRAGSFYGTLRHELCHWFFALISFNKPHALNINGDGSGNYSYSGSRNYGITLAPYFFPLTTISLLLLQVFFLRPAIPYFVLLGVALAFDLTGIKNDFHPRQTDWQQYGVLFSLQFSILNLLIFVMSICVVLFGGFSAYPEFLSKCYLLLKSLFKVLL